MRTSDGFLTTMHDAAQGQSMRWHVAFFNPASNISKVSRLRVVNTSGVDTEVEIRGTDDAGVSAPGGEVRFTLPADEARMLSAQMLEAGDASFEGSLGDGEGQVAVVRRGGPSDSGDEPAGPHGHRVPGEPVHGDARGRPPGRARAATSCAAATATTSSTPGTTTWTPTRSTSCYGSAGDDTDHLLPAAGRECGS